MTRKAVTSVVAGLTATLGVGVGSLGAGYTATNLNELLAAQSLGMAHGSRPLDVNIHGQVVGYYNDTSSSGSQVPFVYTPGVGIKALTQVTPYFQTQASGINDSGVVVGTSTTLTSQRGFVYNVQADTLAYLSPSAVSNGTNTPVKTSLNDINNSGIAVGYVGYAAQFSDHNTRAYRGITFNTASGAATDVGTPFSGSTVFGNTTANQNVVQSINSFGVLGGAGPNTGGAAGNGTLNNTPVFYTATPNGNGTYTYTPRTAPVQAADPNYGGPSAFNIFVDDSGNFAGSYYVTSPTNRRGFFYNGSTGVAVSIDNGNSKTDILGIAGVQGTPILFGSFVPSTASRALVFRNGQRIEIGNALAGTPYAAYTLTAATGINANGDLIAVGSVSNGTPTSFVIPGFAFSRPLEWKGSVNNVWDVNLTANWRNVTTQAVDTFSLFDRVRFSDIVDTNNVPVGNAAITLDAIIGPDALTFDAQTTDYSITGTGSIGGSGTITKSGAGTALLDTANTYTGTTTVLAGTLAYGVKAQVPVIGGTTAAGVDIKGGKVALLYTDNGPALGATVEAALIAGHAQATKFSAGTFRSTELGIGRVLGWVDRTGLSQIEIAYTLAGDANLDFTVNFDDLLILAQNYDPLGTGKTWAQGDSDYDQSVEFDDLLALAQSYGTSLSSEQTLLVGSSFAADYALALSLVPEPTSLVLITGLSCAVSTRRRATRI